MSFTRQQKRHIGHHKGKKNHGFRWLSTSIYVILGLMVIHLMISEGDPPPVRPSVNGRTTKNKGKTSRLEAGSDNTESGSTSTTGDATKKLQPSYRKPEHANTVADLEAESAPFNTIPEFLKADYMDEKQESSNEIMGGDLSGDLDTTTTLDTDGDAGQDETISTEFNGENGANMEGAAEDRDGDPDQAYGEDRGDEDDVDDPDDLERNVHALKANVNAVLIALRDSAQGSMAEVSQELDTELEGHKSEISTMLRPIASKYFPDETTLKVEELVFDRLSENILKSLQEQVEMFIAQESEDVDQMVAEKEAEGLDVMEITGILDNYEEGKIDEVTEEIFKIVKGLKESLPYVIPNTAQETIEKVFEQLGHTTVELEFNQYQQLIMKPPQVEASFSEEEITAALAQVLIEGDEDNDESEFEDTKEEDDEDDEGGEDSEKRDGSSDGEEGEVDQEGGDEGEEVEEGTEDVQIGEPGEEVEGGFELGLDNFGNTSSIVVEEGQNDEAEGELGTETDEWQSGGEDEQLQANVTTIGTIGEDEEIATDEGEGEEIGGETSEGREETDGGEMGFEDTALGEDTMGGIEANEDNDEPAEGGEGGIGEGEENNEEGIEGTGVENMDQGDTGVENIEQAPEDAGENADEEESEQVSDVADTGGEDAGEENTAEEGETGEDAGEESTAEGGENAGGEETEGGEASDGGETGGEGTEQAAQDDGDASDDDDETAEE